MAFYRATEGVYIGSQIQAAHLEELVQTGIRTVICHRPDGEEIGQPDFATVSQWCADYGIQTIYQPLKAQDFHPQKAEELQEMIAQSEKPILLYCRSGQRSQVLWQMSEML